MHARILLVRFLVGVLLVLPFAAITAKVAVAQAAISCDLSSIASSNPDKESATPDVVDPMPFPENAGTVMIFAASSLTDVFGAIEADLERANPGLDLVFNFAGSQALVTQLAEGAEADLFASANTTQMNNAVEAGVISGDPATFASNRLAIVVPADNPAGITSPADLANDGVQLVLAADSVPVGVYARESICLMGADAATYGEDFVNQVAENIVSNETNVRNVLAKVELGEADAGIVYITDATAERADSVSLIEIPSDVNRVADYPIAAIDGGNRESASAFISYLLGPEGQATLAEFGFQAP